jgi:type I restriction enzyme S subunit
MRSKNDVADRVVLSELVELRYGRGLPERKRKPGPFAVYGSNGIVGRHDSYLLDKQTIVLGRKGSIGELTLTEQHSWPIDTTYYVVIKDRPRLDLEYLYYYLRTLDLKGLDTSSAVPGLNRKFVLELEIPLPPIHIQESRAAIIRKAENLLQARGRAEDLTNKIVQSVFLKMFGDNQPRNKIGDVAKFVSSGSTPLGGEKTYLKNGIMFIRSQNVLMNDIDLEAVAHISDETHRKMRRTWVKNGDVLLNITGASLGRVAIYQGPDDNANVNQHVCIVRLDRNKALPGYVATYLATPRAQDQIWTIQAGASRQALNFQQVRSLDLYLPDVKEQGKFANVVRSVKSVIQRQKRSTQEIDELFHSLMRKAFRGELELGSGA